MGNSCGDTGDSNETKQQTRQLVQATNASIKQQKDYMSQAKINEKTSILASSFIAMILIKELKCFGLGQIAKVNFFSLWKILFLLNK